MLSGSWKWDERHDKISLIPLILRVQALKEAVPGAHVTAGERGGRAEDSTNSPPHSPSPLAKALQRHGLKLQTKSHGHFNSICNIKNQVPNFTNIKNPRENSNSCWRQIYAKERYVQKKVICEVKPIGAS